MSQNLFGPEDDPTYPEPEPFDPTYPEPEPFDPIIYPGPSSDDWEYYKQ